MTTYDDTPIVHAVMKLGHALKEAAEGRQAQRDGWVELSLPEPFWSALRAESVTIDWTPREPNAPVRISGVLVTRMAPR